MDQILNALAQYNAEFRLPSAGCFPILGRPPFGRSWGSVPPRYVRRYTIRKGKHRDTNKQLHWLPLLKKTPSYLNTVIGYNGKTKAPDLTWPGRSLGNACRGARACRRLHWVCFFIDVARGNIAIRLGRSFYALLLFLQCVCFCPLSRSRFSHLFASFLINLLRIVSIVSLPRLDANSQILWVLPIRVYADIPIR
jgi:hypothetical protein